VLFLCFVLEEVWDYTKAKVSSLQP